MKMISALIGLLLLPGLGLADGAAPPHRMNSGGLILAQAKDYFHYSHYKVIGMCSWVHWDPWPNVNMTPELDEYRPDLVVTVYNHEGDDPWDYSNTLDPMATGLAGSLFKVISPLHFDPQGNDSSLSGPGPKYQEMRTKQVDVIGNPFMQLHVLWPALRSDSAPFEPYYQSNLDILGLLGIAELAQLKTYNPLSHMIGSSAAQMWGYEFPRDMTNAVPNDYKAAVMSAQHAADIVTNTNELHTVHSVSDSCGTNCAVSNVIEEQQDTNEEWQEVYPHNKHVIPGQNDLGSLGSLGSDDFQAGNGNYMFVVWRHYKGCVQGHGKFMWATHNVPHTVKR